MSNELVVTHPYQVVQADRADFLLAWVEFDDGLNDDGLAIVKAVHVELIYQSSEPVSQ